MNRLVRWIVYLGTILFTLTIVVVVGGFLVLTYMDFSQYRELAEKKLSENLGREVSIRGDFDLQFSLHPSVKLSDITIKNAAWGSAGNALTIGEFYLRMSPFSLLGRPVIDEIILHDAKIYLETKDGKSNLDLDGDKQAAVENATGEESAPKLESPKNILKDIPLIFRADIANIDIYAINHDEEVRREVHIRSITTKENSKNAEVAVNISDIISHGQSLGNLTAEVTLNRKALIVRSLRQGDSVKGTLEYYPNSKIRTDIQFNGFRLETIGALMGEDYDMSGAVNGNITVRGEGKSEKDMLAHLNGSIHLSGRQVSLDKDIASLNFLEFVNFSSNITGCVLLTAPIKEGVISLYKATAYTNIGHAKARGYVDLAQESLDVIADIKVQLPALSANGIIKINGDLYDPNYDKSQFESINIDVKQILGGAAGIANAFGETVGGALNSLLGGNPESTRPVKDPTEKCHRLAANW